MFVFLTSLRFIRIFQPSSYLKEIRTILSSHFISWNLVRCEWLKKQKRAAVGPDLKQWKSCSTHLAWDPSRGSSHTDSPSSALPHRSLLFILGWVSIRNPPRFASNPTSPSVTFPPLWSLLSQSDRLFPSSPHSSLVTLQTFAPIVISAALTYTTAAVGLMEQTSYQKDGGCSQLEFDFLFALNKPHPFIYLFLQFLFSSKVTPLLFWAPGWQHVQG